MPLWAEAGGWVGWGGVGAGGGGVGWMRGIIWMRPRFEEEIVLGGRERARERE